MFCAGLAVAQEPWPYNNNNIGIYFDEAATNYCCGSAPGTFVDMYLVLTHSNHATVAGWEAKVTFEGAGAVVISMEPRYLYINAATIPNEFIVGLGFPQPVVDGKLVLMDIRLYVVDGMIPTYGYVGPTYYHSLPEPLPVLVDGEDRNVVDLMYPPTGGTDNWVVSLNNGCVVPNETVSFGSVKSLFR